MTVVREINRHKVNGSVTEWINGIQALSVTLEPYKDEHYFASKKALNKWYNQNKKQKTGAGPDEKYYMRWWVLLINLIGRSGFLPIRKVDAVFDVNDVTEAVYGKQDDGEADEGE